MSDNVINYQYDTDLTKYLGVNLTVVDEPSDEEIMMQYEENLFLPGLNKRTGEKRINENVFAEEFRDVNKLRYNNGLFYTRFGKRTDEIIARDIWESISQEPFDICTNVAQVTKRLLDAVKIVSTVPALDTNEDVIPFANGDFIVSRWEFRVGEFSPTAYRLSAPLMPYLEPIPNFLKWLGNLFTEEDQNTLQQYLGYCLVNTTRAQKALFLVGEGGAGKSGLGVILQEILGEADINIVNTQEFMQDKFKLAELEHKLVLYDDDLDSAALSDTGLYKKLITNTLTITADRKYGQPFKFSPKAKLVACCNQMLSAVQDTTEGFYRRLLPIVIKPIAPDFVPDPSFYDKLRAERNGITQWALLGLRNLVYNGWVLPESNRTKNYLEQKKGIENPMPEFMDSVFEFGEGCGELSTAEILNVYDVWCRKTRTSSMRPKQVQMWLTDNCTKYGVFYDRIVKDGKRMRGYRGISIKPEWSQSTKIPLVAD